MKAMTISQAGPADSFELVSLPDPKPKAGELLVRISHVGVNHGDVIRRKRGLFPPDASPPYVLGFEGCGVVEETGDGVQGVHAGERVAFLVEGGAYADMIAVPVGQVFRIPNWISDAAAAAIPCVSLTAWHLWRLAEVPPSQPVLIHGGAGGVGSAILQLGREHGVHQIATVASQQKADFAAACGADDVIIHGEADFAERTLEITNGAGVAAVFDCVGRSVLDRNLKVLRRHGRLLVYGSTSGHAEFPGAAVLMNSLTIRGFVIFHQFTEAKTWPEGVNAVVDALEKNLLTPRVDRVLPFSEIPIAHRLIEERSVLGKLVVVVE